MRIACVELRVKPRLRFGLYGKVVFDLFYVAYIQLYTVTF